MEVIIDNCQVQNPSWIPLMPREMFESTFSILICSDLSDRKAMIHDISKSRRPIRCSLKVGLICTTGSEALKSLDRTSTGLRLLRALIDWKSECRIRPSDRFDNSEVKIENRETCLEAGFTVSCRVLFIYKAADVDRRYNR